MAGYGPILISFTIISASTLGNPIPLPKYFKGHSGPTKAMDMGTALIRHKDLPDDLAYLVTKIVCENKEEMGPAHKAWLDFVLAQSGHLELALLLQLLGCFVPPGHVPAAARSPGSKDVEQKLAAAKLADRSRASAGEVGENDIRKRPAGFKFPRAVGPS